jgi:hypothetical protein
MAAPTPTGGSTVMRAGQFKGLVLENERFPNHDVE